MEDLKQIHGKITDVLLIYIFGLHGIIFFVLALIYKYSVKLILINSLLPWGILLVAGIIYFIYLIKLIYIIDKKMYVLEYDNSIINYVNSNKRILDMSYEDIDKVIISDKYINIFINNSNITILYNTNITPKKEYEELNKFIRFLSEEKQIQITKKQD